MTNIQGSAVFSSCGMHRLRLDRWWGEGPRALVCMANPSSAGADKNDPTIHSLIRLLRPHADGFTVVNWETRITSDPDAMHNWRADAAAREPAAYAAQRSVNLDLIRRLSGELCAAIRIVAWGNLVPHVPLTQMVLDALSNGGAEPLYCFGRTQGLKPKHPLARGHHRIPDGFQPEVFLAAGHQP